ncbi:MAG: sensor histidine kinase [Acidimicrobiales bacterium]
MTLIANQARRLLTPAPYLESLHLLLDLCAGITWFTIAVTLLSLSAGLSITLIGIPLLAATVVGFRMVGAIERTRAELLLGQHTEPPAPWLASTRRPSPGIGASPGTTVVSDTISLMRRTLGDETGWKAIAYSLVMLPWGVVAFTLCVVVWSVGLSLIPSALVAILVPGGGIELNGEPVTTVARIGLSVLATVVGVGLLLVTPAIIHGLSMVDRALVSGLLGSNRVAELEQRVEVLTESRDASLSGAATELARLERDLHDGTQQRLVSLAMELGVAKERLASGEPPDRVLPLVTAAHDSSKAAIAELRELVRGVQPGVLADRGLDAALSGLAARSPIPVDVVVDVPARPLPAAEAAAYFIVAEALTNAAKHSGATRLWVDVRRVPTPGPDPRLPDPNGAAQLRVTITDNGRGGAVISPVGGLGGMRDRARSVEGTLTVDSPPGGPTVIRAELPCGS